MTLMPSFRRWTKFSLSALGLAGCVLLQSEPSTAGSAQSAYSSNNHVTRYNLRVDHIPQEKLLGVPTAASMIMAFYGDIQSPRKLKTMSRNRPYIASEPFDDFTITYYRDIVKTAADLGYRWSEMTFADTPAGFLQGLATIKREVQHGQPVMIDLSAPDGHTMVVTGFDETTQCISVVDSNVPAPGRYSISYAQLQSIWNEHAFHKNFRSLVITQPIPYTS